MADCGLEELSELHKDEALRLKVAAIFVILASSALGVAIPLVGRKLKYLSAEGKPFLVAKAFAAGVILATGFVHILGEASERLSSECLPEMPWHKFPWSGFIIMMSALLSLMVDALGTEFYERKHGVVFVHGHGHIASSIPNPSQVNVDNKDVENFSYSQGSILDKEKESEKLRHVVISQVLELGIITHSVIIGISVGVSDDPGTIKPLFAALVFHQFFEGFALGGCIAQAGFKAVSSAFMALSFAITTPVGIAVGIGIASTYNENSQTSLIVQGVFDAVAAGILIYMALVDLIAHDFLGVRMRGNGPLQFSCYLALFCGALAMAVLAIWA